MSPHLFPELPSDIDSRYSDQSPGDAEHQQHHDSVHASLKTVNADGGVLSANEVAATYAPLSVVACRVKRVASYSFNNNAVTAIPWDGEWYDTHGFHDNSTNNTRLTVPAGHAGLYAMYGVWVPDASISAGLRVLCRIKVNGAEVGGSEIEGGGVYASPVAALDHQLAEGDYVEFCSFVAGSGTTSINLPNTTFSIRKVGTL